MNRDLFIDILKRALYGKLDDLTLADHVNYYENYISQEVKNGRTEQEVLDELGDPRLIAKTILETSHSRTAASDYTIVDERGEEEGSQIKFHQAEGWKATLMMALIVLVIILILVFVFKAIVALLPLLIVGGVIIWFLKKI